LNGLLKRLGEVETRLTSLKRKFDDLVRQLRDVAQGLRELQFTGAGGGAGAGAVNASPVPQVVYGITGGGGIPALSGTTLGAGPVTLYDVSGATLNTTAITGTAYNPGSAIAAMHLVAMFPRANNAGEYDVIVDPC
jgi:hypothetical protein